MQREMFKAKLHNGIITDSNVDYMGSFGIDRNLLEMADILPREKVQLVNVTTGARMETYAIEAEAGSGKLCANGGAAKLFSIGDKVLVITYCILDDQECRDHRSRVVLLDGETNHVIENIEK